MTDMDNIREQQEKSADTYATALKIRELLEKLETDWGDEAAERALDIVTGDATGPTNCRICTYPRIRT